VSKAARESGTVAVLAEKPSVARDIAKVTLDMVVVDRAEKIPTEN
jgi:hypothetical protein